jgi:hypothetical protein
MKIDVEINAYDVDVILRKYLREKTGFRIGRITVKSWNADMLVLEDGYVETVDVRRHVLRQEHSDLFKPAQEFQKVVE